MTIYDQIEDELNSKQRVVKTIHCQNTSYSGDKLITVTVPIGGVIDCDNFDNPSQEFPGTAWIRVCEGRFKFGFSGIYENSSLPQAGYGGVLNTGGSWGVYLDGIRHNHSKFPHTHQRGTVDFIMPYIPIPISSMNGVPLEHPSGAFKGVNLGFSMDMNLTSNKTFPSETYPGTFENHGTGASRLTLDTNIYSGGFETSMSPDINSNSVGDGEMLDTTCPYLVMMSWMRIL